MRQLSRWAATSPFAVAGLLGVFVVSAVPAAAQIEVAAGGGIGGFSGDDFEGARIGPTLGGAVRFAVGPLAQIGLGVDVSQYGVEDAPDDLTHIDVHASFRRYTDAPAVRFYYGAKLAFIRQSIDETELVTVTQIANGFAVGPVVGVQAPLDTVRLEAGIDVLYHRHGDFSVDGADVQGSSASGFRWITRVGLAIPVGG